MATSREALLIYCDKHSKHGDLPGARSDALSWNAYLESDLGGGWRDDEVTVLASPSILQLEQKLRSIQNADIGFVTFSGHGYHKQGKDVDSTYLCLNDKEDIEIYKLNCGIPKMIIIADSCRGLEYETELYEARAELSLKKAMLPTTRRRYEEAFSKAERGAIYMYACDVQESASENSEGGLFSSSLVRCSGSWAGKESNSVLDCKEVFGCANKRVSVRAPQQNPQYDGGRRLHHFPFGIT